MRQFLIASTMLLSTLTHTAQADQIFFKNGDKLTGTIVSMNQGEPLRFKAAFPTEIELDWSVVSALYDSAGRPISMPVIQVEASMDTQTVSAEEVLAIQPAAGSEPKEDANAYKWSGRVNLGGKLEDGNSQKKAAAVDATVKARNEQNRYTIKAEANWAEDEGEQTKNDRQLDLEYDRFMDEMWFIGSRLGFKGDEQAELDLRTKLGLFAGYQFFESDDLNLLAKSGLDYINTEYENDKSEDNIAASWSIDYDQRFFEESFQLFHNHDLSVPFDETDAFLLETKTGLRVPVGKHLTGTAEVDFDWDNKPTAGVREQDTTYSVKLGYEW